MNEAPASPPAIPPFDAAPPLPSIRAILRRREVRADIRFFLIVYVLGFILFTSWLA